MQRKKWAPPKALWQNGDASRWALALFCLLLLAAKLVLASAQKVYLDPDEGLLDDMMMYNAAVSITKGEWLGSYGWMTLSKHSFFALWLAGLHLLRVPYLLGGQLLWAAAAALAAWAVLPLLKKRWLAALCFALLLFNPASTANAPFGHTPALGYITRVYRDNIFPALCVLCVTGMVGFALRYERKIRHSAGWLLLAGVGLAAAWLTREDGWWLLPFVLAATGVAAVFILRGGKKARLQKLALLLVPFIITAAGLSAWAGMNHAYYGRFILSDFSSGEFADAYGAMTRIQTETWYPKNAVPPEAREILYEKVPDFARLKPYLESDRYQEKYNNLESGGLYWALREAAAELGIYDTPETARAFWSGMASDINALCDAGEIPAGPQRSSVNPIIRAAYISPVLAEGFSSLWFCATFQQCEPHSQRSRAALDKLAPMEEFLHEKCITAAVENSDQPYFSPLQRLAYALLGAARLVYSILLPMALLAAVCWQAASAVWAVKNRKKHPAKPEEVLAWIVLLGLIFCAVLRVMMIAFVSVSSFSIGTYVMYLASVHPLLILYAFLGCVPLVRGILARKAAAKGAA